MLTLLHGENQYESLKALNDLLDQDSNIIDGEEINDIEEIRDISDSLSLFSTSKTTAIKRFFKNPKKTLLQKDLLKWLQKEKEIPDLVFWEDSRIEKRKSSKPVKNPSTLISFIESNGKIMEFIPKNEYGLKTLINEKFRSFNISADTSIITRIISKLGTDEFMINSELEKLILYVRSRGREKIELEDIDIITLYEPDHKIWDLSDALGRKDKRTAIKLMHELVKTPADFPMVIGASIKQFLEMLVIRKYPGDRSRVIKATSMLPFLYQKNASAAMNFSLSQLQALYNKLIRLDYSVKSGRIDFKLGFTLLIITL